MTISAKISGAIASDYEISLLSLTAKEALSRPFELRVEFRCESPDLKLSQFLGQPMGLEIEMSDAKRYFHGLVTQLVLSQKKKTKFFVYEAILRPWFWFLSQTQDSRIFQGLNVVQIFDELHKDHKKIAGSLDKKLSTTYAPKEYCVQYRESDMNFLGRLMAKEGIYYYFRHSAQGHEMVLCDSTGAHSSMDGFEHIPYIDARSESCSILKWRSEVQVQPTSVLLADFDFLKPANTLFEHAKGGHSQPLDDYEVFDYPADYHQGETGQHYATVRAQAQQAGLALASGETDALAMCCGYTFKTEQLPNSQEDGEYLVRATKTFIAMDADEAGAGILRCGFQVMSCAHVFRPLWEGPLPQIHGPQTAMVVGPKGQPVHTDEHGRVKVLFHWDREGGQRRDERCSCWVRVSQPWAGQAFGMVNIPRLGDEVVVSFLEGNPDRPLITGRVYNDMSRTPYPLPERASVTGVRTRSMGSDEQGQANELRFEDAKDQEYVWLQAQRDFHRWVKRNDHETVQGDQCISIQGGRKEAIQKALEQTVGADVKTTYDRDHHHKVAGDWIAGAGRAVNVSAGTDVAVSGVNVHVKASANLTLEAGAMLTLKVGGSSVVLSAAGVSIDGVLVKINSGGSGASASAPAQPQSAQKPTEQQDPLFGKT